MTVLKNATIMGMVVSGLVMGTLGGNFANADSQPVKKEWTLLVFMNGNNNLDDFGAYDLNEMEKVGSTDQVNVVVQWASLATNNVKRMYVTKDDDDQTVTSLPVQEMGAVDMGSYQALTDFIKWGAEKYPAKRYFVDVWDHGSGWHARKRLGVARSGFNALDISWDDNTGNSITTEQLGKSIKDAAKAIGQKIDIYGSDACLMAMAEVAGEMKGAVNIFLGAQELEPGPGWPYDTFLARLTAKPVADAKEASKMLVEEFVIS
ncbi:MAG: clostripain-related cysteine peptidase, partial [Bdellovibrionota bacterium]